MLNLYSLLRQCIYLYYWATVGNPSSLLLLYLLTILSVAQQEGLLESVCPESRQWLVLTLQNACAPSDLLRIHSCKKVWHCVNADISSHAMRIRIRRQVFHLLLLLLETCSGYFRVAFNNFTITATHAQTHTDTISPILISMMPTMRTKMMNDLLWVLQQWFISWESLGACTMYTTTRCHTWAWFGMIIMYHLNRSVVRINALD